MKRINEKILLSLLINSLIIILLTGCMDDGRGGKPKVVKYSSIDHSGDGYCKEYTEISYDTCYEECPAETHKIGTTEEIAAEIEAYLKKNADNDPELQATMREQLNSIVKYAKGICIKIPVVRPSDQVYINPKFCVCEKAQSATVNDCAAFCAGTSDTNLTLYVSTTVGPKISANEELVDFQGWCTNPLTESADNNTAPSCLLELDSGQGMVSAEVIFTGRNSFKSDLSSVQIAKNKTYVATIVEANQSKARSKSFHVYVIDPSSSTVDNTPLNINFISQYTCIYMYGDTTAPSTTNPTDLFSGNMARMYFYYPSNYPPEILSGSLKRVFCHDIGKYGRTDSKTYPRLELAANAFGLWDKSDLRFYDADNDQKLDINEQIQDRLYNEYKISSTINIFQPFVYNSGIISTTESSAAELKFQSSLQGYYMQPWIDTSTSLKLGYCPKQSHYTSNTAVFRILKELVGNDTEAIYFARSDPRAFTDNNGQLINVAGSTLIVRETILKKVWFYLENGKAMVPTEALAGQKSIMFYYPYDYDTPLTKKPHQTLFTIYNPTEESQNTGDPRPNVLPRNKMFGCIPSLGEAPFF